jgi:hypothetical protein
VVAPGNASEVEEEVQPELTDKALPALTILKDSLQHTYDFHEASISSTWNESELEQNSKKEITLPKADTVTRSLLAALETTFGLKSVFSDPGKAPFLAGPMG